MGCIWSPLPPSPSGIADYAATLFDGCEEFSDTTFVVAEQAERREGRDLSPTDAATRSKNAFLQIGNNTHHAYVYERALRGGAVVEMHDVSLHHLHTELTLANGDAAGYRLGLEKSEGDWGRRFAYQRIKGYYTPNLEFHTRMNRAVTDRADAVIVHSQWARMQLELQDCAAPVYVVPHYALPVEQSPARVANREEARRLLDLPDDAYVILVAGYVTRAKKAEWTLEAFEKLAAEAPEARLVIAGACGWDPVAEMIEASRFRDRIRVTGYLSDAAFCDYTLAADILPVMRFPSAGESSGVAARAMGFGRVVIAPELMAFSDLKETVCEKVHLDRDPVDQLYAHLMRWRNDRDGLRAKEAQVLEYARSNLSPDILRKEIASIVRWHWRD